MQFNRASVSALYSPDTDLPGGARPPRRRVSAVRLDGPRLLEPRRLLRSLRTHQGEPQGALDHAWDTIRRWSSTNRAAHARARRPAGRQSRSVARIPECARPCRSADVVHRAAVVHELPRLSLGRVDDEKGQKWTLATQSDYVNSVVFHARCRPPTTSAARCRCGTRPSGCAARPGFRRSRRRAVCELLLRRLRQQLPRSRRGEALP